MARLARLYSRNPKSYIKKVVELMLAILLAALESEADKQKFTDIYEQYHPQMEQTALRMVGFKGQSKEVYLEDMQGETLPDGSTRYDLGDGDFVIELGN